jgi:hypothetical protein
VQIRVNDRCRSTSSVLNIHSSYAVSVCSRSSQIIRTNYDSYGNVNCKWLFDAGPGNMIVMEKFTLAFGYCNDCSCGRLEVFDSKSDSEARLGSWCSTPVPELISTGRFLYVKFSAKSYSTYQKFEAFFKSIKNQTGTSFYYYYVINIL